MPTSTSTDKLASSETELTASALERKKDRKRAEQEVLVLPNIDERSPLHADAKGYDATQQRLLPSSEPSSQLKPWMSAIIDSKLSSTTTNLDIVLSVIAALCSSVLYFKAARDYSWWYKVGGEVVNAPQNILFGIAANAALRTWNVVARWMKWTAIIWGSIAALAPTIMTYVITHETDNIGTSIGWSIPVYLGNLPMSIYGIVQLLNRINHLKNEKDNPEKRNDLLAQVELSIENLTYTDENGEIQSLTDKQKNSLKSMCSNEPHNYLFKGILALSSLTLILIMTASISGYICSPTSIQEVPKKYVDAMWVIGITSMLPTISIIALKAAMSVTEQVLNNIVNFSTFLALSIRGESYPLNAREKNYYALKSVAVALSIFAGYYSTATTEHSFKQNCPSFSAPIDWFVANVAVTWGTIIFNSLMCGPVALVSAIQHQKEKRSTGFDKLSDQIQLLTDAIKNDPMSKVSKFEEMSDIETPAPTAIQSSASTAGCWGIFKSWAPKQTDYRSLQDTSKEPQSTRSCLPCLN